MRFVFLCIFLAWGVAVKANSRAYAAQNDDSLKLLREIFLVNLKTDPAKSISIARKSLSLSKRLNDKKSEGEALYNIGQGHYFIGQYSQAMDHYRQATHRLTALGEKLLLADVYNATGNCYVEVEDYASAVTNYKRSLFLMADDSSTRIKVYNNIGSVNILIKRYDSASFYFGKTMALSKGDPRQRLVYLSNIGYIRYELGEYAEAITLYREGIAMAEALDQQNYLPRFYKNLADCYLREGSRDSSFNYLQKSLDLSRQMKRYAQEVDVLLSLAAYYDSADNIKQAIVVAENARTAAENTTNFNKGRLYSALSSLYSKDGDLKKAFYYEKRNAGYLDSVRMAKQKQAIAPENVPVLKADESATVWRTGIAWVAGILMVASGAILFHYYRKRRTPIIREADQKAESPQESEFPEGKYIKGQFQGGETLVPVEEVIWFEKEERAYFAITETTKYRIRPTITELEAILPAVFVRINRSVIINLSFLLNYSSWENNKYIVRMTRPEGREFVSTRDRIRKIEEQLLP